MDGRENLFDFIELANTLKRLNPEFFNKLGLPPSNRVLPPLESGGDDSDGDDGSDGDDNDDRTNQVNDVDNNSGDQFNNSVDDDVILVKIFLIIIVDDINDNFLNISPTVPSQSQSQPSPFQLPSPSPFQLSLPSPPSPPSPPPPSTPPEQQITIFG